MARLSSLLSMRRAAPALLLLALAFAALLAGRPGQAQAPARPQAQAAAQAADDQGILAGFLSRLLSTPTSRVAIGAVEGALSSDATIRNVTVADDAGVYLTIDRIRIDWRRSALLQRRIEVERLEIGRVTLLRRPAAVSGEPEPGPILPELPLALRVGAFTLGELVLGEPVLGTPARLSATGSASLGAPAEGLRAELRITRRDAGGTAALDLAFAPQGERLDLVLNLDEPAGGLLARLANVPGQPPVRLDLAGRGVLDDWRARLAFEAGPEIGASGQARLARVAAGPVAGGRLLSLDLDARIAPLLPPVAAPIFAGVTALRAEAGFPDAGGVDLRSLTLTAPLAELTARGALSAERTIDLTLNARALPNAGGAGQTMTAAGEARLARLVFTGTASGPLASPRVAGAIDLAGLATPDLSLEALTGRFSLTPLAPDAPAAQPVSAAAPARFAFDATAAARGARPADLALAEALGRDLDLTHAGRIEGGVASFTTARLASPTVQLDYDGRLGARLAEGTARARILDLSAFSRLASRSLPGASLRGQARLEARLSGDPGRPDLTAAVTGEGSRLRVGQERIDRLIGGTLSIAGGVGLREGTLRLDRLRLDARAVSGELDGLVSEPALSLNARLAVRDLAALDSRLQGAADLTATITGPSGDPTVALRLAAPEARALGRPVRGLGLTIDGRRLLSAPDLAVSGEGQVGGKPLRLQGRVQNLSDGGWAVEGLDASLGSVSLAATGRLGPGGLLSGRAALEAGDLDDVSALALTKLSGRLSATLEAGLDGGQRQRLAVRATGAGVSAPGFSLGSLAADLTADDLYGRPVLRGEARIAGLTAAGQRFETLTLTAADGGEGTSAVRLAGRGGGFDLTAEALVRPGPPTAIRLEVFRAVRNGRAIALASPTDLVLRDGGVAAEALALEVAGGRVSLSGLAGRDLDLKLRWSAIPLAAADIVAPGLGLAGVTEGEATLSGPAAGPTGPFSLTVRGLSAPALRNAGAPPLDLSARGRLTGSAAEIEATLRGGRAIDIAIAGSAAFAGDGPLDLSARGAVDAGFANARLAPTGQRVAGRLALDARLGGSREAPRVTGSASLSGGSFSDAAQGVAITGISGRAVASGETITIERLTGATRDGGTVSLSGRVAVDPAAGFPGDLRLTARQARLLDGPVARLVADLDLGVTGPLAASPQIRGRVAVASLDLRIPERLGGAREPLRDARHIAPPRQVRARLAQAARVQGAGRRGAAPFRAGLDVTVDAPARVFVRGRGLDAELGGRVRLTGTTLAPIATGAFELRRGRLTILTQRLDFTRGALRFGGGGLLPDLDLLAETRAGDVTARIAVTGPADAPSFAFSSTPALPEDEVLSRLLFERAAGGLSAFQALQLAQAAAQLSGAGGPDPFEATRRALGVDDLDVNVGPAGPTVGLSRAIGDRARLNIRAGARPESTGVGLDIDLTRRLRLQSEITSGGGASVGIGIEQEY